jgi:hypothetical protein
MADTLAGSMLGLFTGDTTILVGVEDDPDGGLRCYVGARYRGLYVIVDDPKEMERVQHAWAGGGHVLMPVPPAECVYSDKEDAALPSRDSDQPKET